MPPRSRAISSAASSPPLKLSVATKLTISSEARSESMMTVGIPSLFASSTGRTSALSSSGASTIPLTPWLVKPSTTWTCCSRSSSRMGPFQMTSTRTPSASRSREALIAPAWMLFQNSWVSPLGMTATLKLFVPVLGGAPPPPLQARPAPAVARIRAAMTTGLLISWFLRISSPPVHGQGDLRRSRRIVTAGARSSRLELMAVAAVGLASLKAPSRFPRA